MRSLWTRAAEWWWFLELGRSSPLVSITLQYHTLQHDLQFTILFVLCSVLLSRYRPDGHGQRRTDARGGRHGQNRLEHEESNRQVSGDLLRHREGQT